MMSATVEIRTILYLDYDGDTTAKNRQYADFTAWIYKNLELFISTY